MRKDPAFVILYRLVSFVPPKGFQKYTVQKLVLWGTKTTIWQPKSRAFLQTSRVTLIYFKRRKIAYKSSCSSAPALGKSDNVASQQGPDKLVRNLLLKCSLVCSLCIQKSDSAIRIIWLGKSMRRRTTVIGIKAKVNKRESIRRRSYYANISKRTTHCLP